MTSVPHVAAALRTTLIDVPKRHQFSSGFCQRRSKLTAAAFVQILTLGWLAHPSGSLQQLVLTARDIGVSISPQGLDQRFGEPGAALLAEVFAEAVAHIVTADPVAVPLLERFPAVVLLDSTTITLPNELDGLWVSCGGRTATTPTAAVKATVRLDLCRGGLEGPVLSAGRDQDKGSSLQHAPVPPGALRIGDLGFWGLRVLQDLRQQRAHFLSRLHVQTVVNRVDTGKRLDVVAWLRSQQADQVELAVTLGAVDHVPARLLAVRVLPAVAAQRRRTIRARAEREGQTPSQKVLDRADWVLVVTSVPAGDLTLAEAMVLLRARWQIELLFKLWKSHGSLDEWRSHNPDRILCEFYAKLIALVIQHWIVLTGGWEHADRSLVRLSAIIRERSVSLAANLHHPATLRRALRGLARTLAACRPIEKRRAHPSTAQLLANPALGGLA